MAKKFAAAAQKKTRNVLSQIWGLIAWITGVLVSLAVGWGMIGEGGIPLLSIPYVPDALTVFAGWVVVLLTIIGAILAIIDKLTS